MFIESLRPQPCRAQIESLPPAVKVISDFPALDTIRLGVAQLNISFTDIHRAVNRIGEIVEGKVYRKYSGKKIIVT